MRFLILIATLFCWLNFNTAAALAPVILTTDQATKLDLASNEAKSIDLLDCQLHVEGQAPNYRLVHSKGELPIPTLAVKSIQDDALVEIAVRGELAGLPIIRMLVTKYTKAQLNESMGKTNKFEDKIMPQGGYSFLIQGDEAKVARALKQKIGKEKVYVQQSEIKDERVIVIFNNPNLENIGGYGFESWFSIHQTTQVEYECVF